MRYRYLGDRRARHLLSLSLSLYPPPISLTSHLSPSVPPPISLKSHLSLTLTLSLWPFPLSSLRAHYYTLRSAAFSAACDK